MMHTEPTVARPGLSDEEQSAAANEDEEVCNVVARYLSRAHRLTD